ncbi:MAG: hypothetical protein WAO02_18505 [Verrucomicrobiia bacterium]
MNLGKLLVAGKSIINGGREISYRANKHVYLPKFGPTPNPFQPSAGTEAGETGSETVNTPVRKIAPPVPAKTQKLPPWPPGPARASSWASKLNPISIWREAHPAAHAPQPVQSELSLEGVKVVHNDLSDADVEVVPMKSRTADAAAIPELPPPTRPWEFLAERMFHVTTD